MSHTAKYGALAGMLIALVMSGCTTKPAPVAAETPSPVETADGSGASESGAIAPGSARDFQVNVGDRVLFAFDRFDVDSDNRAILRRQATWLANYPAVTLVIEGHCDERGTREYNLALGARRAHAVKEYLTSLGISVSRLETISYGKERPACADSNESCWSQNRRGVSVIKEGAQS